MICYMLIMNILLYYELLYIYGINDVWILNLEILNLSCLALQLLLPNPLKPGIQVENEDVFGAAPTTTSEWSTILLPSRVRLILEVLRYIVF